MIDPVSGVAGATSASHLQLVSGGGSNPAASPTQAQDATPAADGAKGGQTPAATPTTRVYIDRSASGVYVYQLVNAATGRVLVELPRAQSDSIKVLDGYEPGAAAHVSA